MSVDTEPSDDKQDLIESIDGTSMMVTTEVDGEIVQRRATVTDSALKEIQQ